MSRTVRYSNNKILISKLDSELHLAYTVKNTTNLKSTMGDKMYFYSHNNIQKEHQRCSEGGTIIPGSNGNTANSWGAFIISSITILRTTFYRTHT